jgi:hypothetical protein
MIFPTQRLSTLGILLVAVLIGLSACTSTRPTPITPDAAPPMIMVDGGSLPTLSFDKLFTDIPGGRTIGYQYEGLQYTRVHQNKWDENFENETKDLNALAQNILGQAGYNVEGSGLGQLRLEGTIRKLTYNTFTYKASFDQAECELKWELFRAGEDSPYFTRLTNGEGRVEGNKPGAIMAAFELALRRLLTEQEFVDAVGSR